MERKKEIEKAAREYMKSDAVSPMNMQLAYGDFINGAEWADKTMIEKATTWLFENVYDYLNPEDQERVESFRKAMLFFVA